jgi:hypothetical protein
MSSSFSHFSGSLVLLGVASSLPGTDRLIAAVAAAGLALTGIAAVLKQARDFWRSRQASAAARCQPAPAPKG